MVRFANFFDRQKYIRWYSFSIQVVASCGSPNQTVERNEPVDASNTSEAGNSN